MPAASSRLLSLAALLAVSSALVGCGGGAAPRQPAGAPGGPGPEDRGRIAVVLPERGRLALVDLRRGAVAQIPVGASPWGVAVAGRRAYVSAARHVAVVDLDSRRVVARVPYRMRPSRVEQGEYRAGGMGIAAGPGGRRVYVGVHAEGGGRGRLEVLDTRRLAIVATAPIGTRPFDVLVGRRGGTAFTVDHDSYGVTSVDARSMETRTFPVAPLGRGAFDKLNYGAVDGRGRLLLPINGEILAVLDPRTGRVRTRPMRSRVHQAGVALSRGRLLTVGAEALAGGSGPNLSVFDLASGRERVLRTRRPHEDVAVDRAGRTAFLTGGYTRGGWSGVTVVDLASGGARELPLAAPPLGIAILPR